MLSFLVTLGGTGSVRIASETPGYSAEHAIDTFSTWYVAPESKLTITCAADSAEPLVIFIASPNDAE